MSASRPLPFFHPASLLATWFGSGLAPFASGTWGSLAALPFGVGIYWLGGAVWLTVAAVLCFAIGVWASERYAAALGQGDPSAVVIDEVAGQWLALVPAALDPILIGVSFFFFRLFDVLKPWPAGWCDKRLKGGMGIMLDDIFAGIYAGLVVFGVARLLE